MNPATLATVHTAAKTYPCYGCLEPIGPGARYLKSKLAPSPETGTKWWVVRTCAACCAVAGRPLTAVA